MYTVLDFETTGLDHRTDQVIEIGAIKFNKDMKHIGTFHTMVKLEEGRELDPFITELTGIKPEDLVNGMQEREALVALTYFIGSDVVVAQNAPFDLSFLSRLVDDLEFEFFCTRTMATLLEPDKSASLKYVTERLGIELNNHHQAMVDVEATAKVFAQLVDLLARNKGILPMDYKNKVVASPDRPLTYKPPKTTGIYWKEDLLKVVNGVS